MSRNLKLSGALIAVVVLFIGAAFIFSATRSEPSQAATQPTGNGQVQREDSHVLGEPGSSDVTLVEFLDFECPSCGAMYPFVEELRQTYAGQVTFVARHFPLPMHSNANDAALAAEAAAQQDQFEAMYSKLFQTQNAWGGQDNQAATFRGYAEELGLDLAEYDAALADPATQERVDRDQKDGEDLQVPGTPTFFLNGKLLQPESAEEFTAAIDEALKS
ncbi:DsbA family protein [Kineosporia babensis]|uniref:DsbA family protein n=1 Tax=Kineosporia babensis TaxID=499548 RepID=A0A9X1SWK8_9ACTN|nr:thioredoxin domain-containing protein [Kineosporia babensis]MCD5315192.1 DsbA family protein [Kineosporia babensis]